MFQPLSQNEVFGFIVLAGWVISFLCGHAVGSWLSRRDIAYEVRKGLQSVQVRLHVHAEDLDLEDRWTLPGASWRAVSFRGGLIQAASGKVGGSGRRAKRSGCAV